MFEVHPSARDSFDTKAIALLQKIIKVPVDIPQESDFKPEFHIPHTLTEEDIIGEVEMSSVDYRGNVVCKFFQFQGDRYGLPVDAYKELRILAESIQKLPAFREKLSIKYIEDALFNWVRSLFSDKNFPHSFSSFLFEEAVKVVKPIVILFPIFNTSVEQGFQFCGAVIRNFSKKEIDDIEQGIGSIPEEDRRASAQIFLNNVRQKFQGYAVIEFRLECEPEYANTFGLDRANKICDLLGIYHDAILVPDLRSSARPKGSENVSHFNRIDLFSNGRFSVSSGFTDVACSRGWPITKKNLQQFSSWGVPTISELVCSEKISDFEFTVLNMVLLYSKAAFTSDPLEKLVYVLSALESTLLKNESEPIQQNLAERLAVFVSNDLQERKAIIKNIRFVYGLRSRYLHHGHSIADLDELSNFLNYTWSFYLALVGSSKIFQNKVKFLEFIDDKKLG